MKYEKKIIILSEVNSGFSRSQVRATLTIEKSALGTRCVFTVFNLRDMDNGEYLLGITLKDARTEVKNLGRDGRINAVFDLGKDSALDGKISAVLAYAKDGSACAVAYGSNDNKRIWEANMLDGIIRKPEFFSPNKTTKHQTDPLKTILQNKENKQVESIIQSTETQNDEKATPQTPLFLDIISSNPDYADNAVAVENYYPKDYGDSLNEAAFTATKKSAFRALRPYKLRQQKIKPEEHTAQTQSTVSPKYIQDDLPSPPKIPELNDFELTHSTAKAKTTVSVNDNSDTQPQQRYYEQIRTQIDELFSKFPSADDINELLPDTRWVKVDYDGTGKYYVIGLIGDEPSYVAYGVPARYSKNPPRELEGYCQWFPLDYKNPQGDGYWLMYQDANSGDCVDVEII